jgi:HAMP domain-containing protein
MPSLHSAFALFVVVFFWRWVTDWRWRALMLLYPLAMAIALAYFAEHYFIDAIAGWAIVGASFFAWNRIERSLDARRAARTELDADGTEMNEPAPVETEGAAPDEVLVDAMTDGDLAQSNPR